MDFSPALKQFKRTIRMLFFMVISFFVLWIIKCVSYVGEVKTLQVSLRHANETYKEIQVLGNQFSTGVDGNISWKVKNIKEAVLVSLSENKPPIDIYNVFYFLAAAVVVYKIFYKTTDDTIFSVQVLKKFGLIYPLIYAYPFYNILCGYISRFAVNELTENQFTKALVFSNITSVMLLIYFVWILSQLFKKGISLQKEQDLTI